MEQTKETQAKFRAAYNLSKPIFISARIIKLNYLAMEEIFYAFPNREFIGSRQVENLQTRVKWSRGCG